MPKKPKRKRACPLAPPFSVGSPSHLSGVLWATAAVGLFSLIYISGKLSDGQGSALQIIWLRYVGGLLTMAGLLLVTRRSRKVLYTPQPWLHAGRALAGGLAGVAAVYAAAHMPVASASAIGLLDGVLITVLGAVALREHISRRHWAASGLGLTGAIVVLGGQGAFSLWDSAFLLPAAIALAGALMVALESILIKMLVSSEKALTVLFYVNLFGALLLAGPGLAAWKPLPAIWLAAFLALGPIALLAQYCNLRAFRAAPASLVGPMRYTWVVYGALFGVCFFNERLGLQVIAGCLLILASGAWLASLPRLEPR